jgi:SAM domain (Sterile alpha motif)
VTRYTEGFSHFVTSMTAPVASGWSDLAGWDSHPLESAALSRRTPIAVIQKSMSWSPSFTGIMIDHNPRLGLTQYEALFRENDIDTEVLAELTESDLTGLGASLRHRKQLLKAIANLGSTETAAKPATSVPPQTSPDTAERRQLTVMFCDLVGSTVMSPGSIPRICAGSSALIITAAQTRSRALGGSSPNTWATACSPISATPQAHEHDSERAVQAGLAIVEAAPKLVTAAGSPLHVRIGIATGSSSGTSLDRGRRKFLFYPLGLNQAKFLQVRRGAVHLVAFKKVQEVESRTARWRLALWVDCVRRRTLKTPRFSTRIRAW